jgi:hypothetical protein
VEEGAMVTVNRVLWAALGLVGCLTGVEFGYPYLESLNIGTSEKEALVRPEAPAMERRLFVLPQRMKAQRRVIGQLVDGRIDLFEAAAWFRYLNETPPDCPGESIEHWPGASPEEKLCRQVIDYVRNDQRRLGSEGQADELARRLEQQLADALARPGGLVLPPL